MTKNEYRSAVENMSRSMKLGDSFGVDMIIMLIQKKYSPEIAQSVFDDARKLAAVA